MTVLAAAGRGGQTPDGNGGTRGPCGGPGIGGGGCWSGEERKRGGVRLIPC
jgi:hypothetical protein